MKRNQRSNGAKKPPVFVARAERAFSRVARKLRAENRKRGLSPVVWPNGGPRGSLKSTRAITANLKIDDGRFSETLRSLPWQDLRPSYCFGPLTGPTPTWTKSAGAAPPFDSQ